MRVQLRRRLLIIVAAGSALIALAGFGFDLFQRVEAATLDTRFELRGERSEPGLVTVAIDERTRAEYPRQRYPFPRRFDADVIETIRRDGARVIAYDVEFTEATTEDDDIALLEAVSSVPKAVFAASKVDDQGRTRVFGGVNVQRQVGARVGSVNFTLDPGGVFRQVDHAVDGLKTFSVVAAELATGKPIWPRDIGGDRVLIDFAGPPFTIKTISYVDVRRGDFRPGTFKDKIVVVGASDPALQDVHPTPTSGGGLMPGPEIQANAISTMLRGAPLRETRGILNYVLIALLSVVIPLVTLRVGPLRAQVITLVLGAGYLLAVQLAFNSGDVLPVLYPLGGLVMSSTGAITVHYLLAAGDRRRARETFARFVPQPIVDELLALTGGDVRLGGSRVTATVMFSDIRGFTSFSESRQPEEVIEVLNRYLEEMTEAILDHGGTLVNYIGDGIMAIWGAPLDQPDQADRALATACEMLDVRLPRFNEWMRENGHGHLFRIGVGLHTGPLVAGNVGSTRHLQYTAIGDTCNTASRIEGLTKEAGYPLLVSGATYALLEGDREALEFVSEAPIRGRVEKISLYGLRREEQAGAA